MNSEDRLDALLTTLLRPERRPQRDDATDQRADWQRVAGLHPIHQVNGRSELAQDDDLAPLVATARRLSALDVPLSDPAVAQAIKARVLARATERREQGDVAAKRTPRRLWTRPTIGWDVLRPALVAAVVFLVLGVGTVVAAAQASPGSPLFALHRIEQSVQANAALDSTSRARQHLKFAREWLATLRAAATQNLDNTTYADALHALRDEDDAAASEIAQMQLGTQRTALEADLGALRTDERATLRATLLATSWPNRIAATTALGALGVEVPRVTSATLVEGAEGHWQVTLSGKGFQPGALLLVNGQPAGTVTATSSGVLTATLPLNALTEAPSTLGVGNPDGTAAATTSARMQKQGDATATPEHNAQGTPSPGSEETPVATVTPDGQQQGTPTPETQPQATPAETGP